MIGGLRIPLIRASLPGTASAWSPRSARGAVLCAVLTWVGAVWGASPWETPGLPDAIGGYSSSQIVVQLSVNARDRIAALRGRGLLALDADPRPALSEELQTISTEWRVSRMRPAYAGPFGDPALARKYGLDRTYIVEVPAETDTPTMATAFAAIKEDVELATVDTMGGVTQFIPNDPGFDLLYGLHNFGQVYGSEPDADIDAPEAWEFHTGDLGTVTIAIIDSGVSPHVEFGDRLIPGTNTADPEWGETRDDCPHGTHVAGIAAAAGDNGIGVAGVTWGANIMPVRVLDTFNPCGGYVSALAAGIVWAADNGADIANMSLQYNLDASAAQFLHNAINYAHQRGMLLVAATGNNNSCGAGAVCFPARLQNCMAVGGTTAGDVIAEYSNAGWSSNFGPETDLCAPGDDIYSTWVGGSYRYLSGSSMATAYVSGLAALIKSHVPDATNGDLRLTLITTADDLGPTGWDDHYGHGRINAHSALASPPSEYVPAVSEWGLVVTALMGMTAGTLVFSRRSPG